MPLAELVLAVTGARANLVADDVVGGGSGHTLATMRVGCHIRDEVASSTQGHFSLAPGVDEVAMTSGTSMVGSPGSSESLGATSTITMSLLTVVGSLVAAAFATWLTALFALRRSRSDRLLERRWAAYLDVLSGLNEMRGCVAAYLDVSRIRFPPPDDVLRPLQTRWTSGRIEASKALALSSLLFTPRAVDAVRQCLRVIDAHSGSARGTLEAIEAHSTELLTSIDECLAVLQIEARHELHVRAAGSKPHHSK